MLTEAQFVELYTNSFHRIKCFCAKFDYDNQEDLAQKTFTLVWEKRNSFLGLSKLSTWTFSIALNVCRNEFRKMKPLEFVPIDGLEFPIAPNQFPSVLAEQLLGKMKPKESQSILNLVSGNSRNLQKERNLRYRGRRRIL